MSLTEPQKLLIADELQRLFVLQGQHFSKEKSAIFLEELEKAGLPAGALIAGIRGLMNEDLSDIKLNRILAASRSKMTYETSEKVTCEHCDSRGLVMMRDANAYEFAFACTCSNANRYVGHQKWNGESTQYQREMMFTKRFA